MNIKAIVGSVLTLTLIALVGWVSPADAGGGGEGIPLGNVFALNCYVINGANPPHELSLDDQFYTGAGDPSVPPSEGCGDTCRRSPVALGKAKLLCTVAAVGLTTRQEDTPINNKWSSPIVTDHLVCYETPASTPKTSQPVPPKTTEDPFVTQTVQIGAPAYTCVGALKCDANSTTCPALPSP